MINFYNPLKWHIVQTSTGYCLRKFDALMLGWNYRLCNRYFSGKLWFNTIFLHLPNCVDDLEDAKKELSRLDYIKQQRKINNKVIKV